jgi:uncharacterized protein (TIGR02246 family)
MKVLTLRGVFQLALATMSFAGLAATSHAQSQQQEEQAVRALLAQFYEAWNAHDVDKMVSVYAEDVDHINVFAEWHRGRQDVGEDLRLLHTKAKYDIRKTYTVEKIRFVRPDLAVVQVRSLSTVGNLGTYVLSKAEGRWQVVSFTNVAYKMRSDRLTLEVGRGEFSALTSSQDLRPNLGILVAAPQRIRTSRLLAGPHFDGGSR